MRLYDKLNTIHVKLLTDHHFSSLQRLCHSIIISLILIAVSSAGQSLN